MMDGPLKERDWKHMRSIHDEMLHKLCENINRRAVEIVTSGSGKFPRAVLVALPPHTGFG